MKVELQLHESESQQETFLALDYLCNLFLQVENYIYKKHKWNFVYFLLGCRPTGYKAGKVVSSGGRTGGRLLSADGAFELLVHLLVLQGEEQHR